MLRPRFTLRVACIAPILAVCASLQEQAPLSRSAEPPTQVFPIAPYQREYITVPLSVGGSEHLFVVDSGASKHIYDHKLQRFLGPHFRQQEVRQADGTYTEVELFHPPEAKLGQWPIPNAGSVACTDLSLISSFIGREVHGILGIALFRNAVIQIDFERSEMTIMPPTTTPQVAWGESLPVSWKGNLPVIQGEVGDLGTKELVIDTGYNGLLTLHHRDFDQLQEIGGSHDIRETGATLLDKEIRSLDGMLALFKLRQFAHENLEVDRTDGRSSLGLLYFRQFLVTFDLGRSQIFLQPNSNLNIAPRTNAAGVVYRWSDGRPLIHFIHADSPGERAGAKCGDELVAIHGASVTGKSAAELYSLLDIALTENDEAAIIIARNGEEKTLILLADEKPMH